MISVGKNNPYGHPAEEVLQMLAEFAITILRTDQLGDIKMVSDKQTISIKN